MYALGYLIGYTAAFIFVAFPPIALVIWACRRRPYIAYKNPPLRTRRGYRRAASLTAIDPVGPLQWDSYLGKYV